MAAEWQTTTLSDVCSEVRYGYTAKAVDTDTGVRFLRGTDISGRDHIDWNTVPFCEISPQEESRYSLEHGDIVIVRMGTIGETAIIKHPPRSVCASYLIRHRINTAVAVPAYVHYVLRSPMFAAFIQSHGGGSVQPNINATVLGEFTFRLPPVPVQQAIANVLSALDDKIELNRRMNQTLEATTRAIFKSWFVDFDPVRAKAAGQKPAGLKPDIAALFPDSFEDSELGEIPKGWFASSVGHNFRLTMGQSPPGSTYNENGEGTPFYQGRADFGFRFPRRRVYCSAPKRFAEPGDTLVSVRAPVGDINMAYERCAVGRGVAAIRHRSNSRSFTYCAMHQLAEHFLKFEAEGTVFGCINKADFERLPFVEPSPEVLAEFDRVVSPLDDRIETNEEQIRLLASIRDTLLPKLISGELVVAEAERIAGRCV